MNILPNFPKEHRQKNSDRIYEEEEERNQIKYYLSPGSLRNDESLVNKNQISFLSPEETGMASGDLLGLGHDQSANHPVDQREDDGRSLIFDSLPLTTNCGNRFTIKKF